MREPKQKIGAQRDDSDFDSEIDDFNLDTAFQYYDIMTPVEKLTAIIARTRSLRSKSNQLSQTLKKLADESSDESLVSELQDEVIMEDNRSAEESQDEIA